MADLAECPSVGETVVIERRFRGPPESANGGYACGLVAAAVEPAPAVEVTLRAPPPLDRPLALARGDGRALLRDGEQLVAEGTPAAPPDDELPEPVSLEQAERARRGSFLHERHPFPMCFVCGTERPGDGLRVTFGLVEGREVAAAPYAARGSDADAEGRIRDEILWAVLDCPSSIAALADPGARISVLGRLTASLERPVEAERDYVAIGWPLGRDGRKLHGGSAIMTPEGECLARARATWIVLREQPG